MKRGMIRSAGVVVLAVFACLLARCISAQEHDLVVYDAAKDEFRMLMVLEDIQVKDDKDLDYLQALYNNRDHLIAPLVPGGAIAFPMSAIRMSDNEAAFINIFGQRPGQLENIKTTASLDSVKITPGTFFLENKKLGYYQAVTVPGKAIDAVLADLSANLPFDDMAKGIDDELARRDAGGATHTWAELKEDVKKNMAIKPKPKPGEVVPAEENIKPLQVLDADSLKQIKQAMADKKLALTRSKQLVSTSIPLSAKDAVAAADFLKQVIADVDEVVKNTKETPEIAAQLKQTKGFQAALKAVTVAADGNNLVVAIDILKLARGAESIPDRRVDLNNSGAAADDQPKAAAPDPVAYVREKKLGLDEKLTAAQIVKEFQAGTLKGHPSETPLKPGEGIAAPQGQ